MGIERKQNNHGSAAERGALMSAKHQNIRAVQQAGSTYQAKVPDFVLNNAGKPGVLA